MTYETLFDTTEVSFSYGISAALIALGAIAIAWAARAVIHLAEGQTSFLRAFKGLAVGIVGFGMFYLVGTDWRNYQKLQAAAASGTGVSQVEGRVQDHWVKEEIHETSSKIDIETIEHFRIGHTHFQFVQGRSKGGYFSNSGDSATELRDGMRLRVAFIKDGENNRIVKLEIAR